ncbi:META domain-containing protein [Pannonibacter sp. SL95]|uniref:META domain-containing protein n=1 Tax=Pannonibacter sp. SL95 TaxID=2995153 RepID=UPI002275773B|nr:META domain-containing protein [Pannonibacter sp. SL95]MCY1707360.1 META domain-containing protein [Pannonibacter sp. SL95]
MRRLCLASVAALMLTTGAVANPLDGTYRIQQLAGQPVDWAGFLQVEGSRVTLQSPCNSYAATWRADGTGRLTPDMPMIGTQAVCASPELSSADATLRQVASRAEWLAHRDGWVRLQLSDGTILIEAIR